MNDTDLWDTSDQLPSVAASVWPPTQGEGQDAALRWYFLKRLERCLRASRLVLPDPALQRLVRRATFSIYCDCLALGAEREAQHLLRVFLHPPSAA
ncbi:MAG: hypothetical protein C4289_16655 [Chloroflexota bacterium]